MADRIEVDAKETERVEAYFEDTLNTMATAVDENWSPSRTRTELDNVGREHGFWRQGSSVSLDGGLETPFKDIVSVGVSKSPGELGFGVKFDVRDRDAVRSLSDGADTGGLPVGISLNRKIFGEINIGAENTVRGGVEFSGSVSVDTTLAGRALKGDIEMFLNKSRDGSVEMGVSGSAVPGLLKGRLPVTVGGTYKSTMVDTDMVIDQNVEIYRDMIEAAGPGGQTWARDVMEGVLDDNGGGGNIPKDKMVFTAAIGEHELDGTTRFGGRGNHPHSLEEHSNFFSVEKIPENEGFYRVKGRMILAGRSRDHGYGLQDYDSIMDSGGNVVDGYLVEHMSGDVSAPMMGSFGTGSMSELGISIGPANYASQRQQDSFGVQMREEHVAHFSAELDALAETDLSAIHPNNRQAIWRRVDVGEVSLDRLEASMEAKTEAAQEAVAARAADGSLSFMDMATGKVMAHPEAAGAYMEGLRGAGVDRVDIPVHEVGDAVATVRATYVGLRDASRDAGLEPPQPVHDPAHDHTGVSWSDYLKGSVEDRVEAANEIVRDALGRGQADGAETGPPEHIPDLTPVYGHDVFEHDMEDGVDGGL